MRHSVVIVGSGVGGLLFALTAARMGSSVTILEKEPRVGGLLRRFSRQGNLFDTGMHYFGLYNEGEPLRDVFSALGVARYLSVSPMPSCFDTVVFGERSFEICSGPERFVRRLSEYVPSEKKAVRRYIEMLKSIYDSVDIYTKRTEQFLELPSISLSARSVVEGLTENSLLRNLFFAHAPLYGGHASVPLFVHAIVSYSLLSGPWKPHSDSDMAEEFRQAIDAAGITVKTGKKVVSVETDNRHVTAVMCESGERFTADTIVSDIDPRQLFSLFDDGVFRKSFVKRMCSLPQTVAPFVLFISFKAGGFPARYSNTVLYEKPPFDCPPATENLSFYMLFATDNDETGQYARSTSIMTFLDFDTFLKWQDSTRGERPEEYYRFKQQITEHILSAVERTIPDFRASIQSVEAATPLTFHDYVGMERGGTFGVERDFRIPEHTFVAPRTKISNLLLVGQNTALHGLFGVMVGVLSAAEELYGSDAVRNMIRENRS